MPLDLRHPTAPHQKLKLPEWYASNLMMDRALDAICRRVKKFDRKHDVPYLAGYSLDGKTIYIDRHMPASFKFKGRTINTDRFLILHEEVEKTLIDQLGLHYLHAHQIATRAEEAAVRAAGLVWGFYCQAISEQRSLFLAFSISFFVRRGIPFLRPDPQYCKAGARRSCQGWPSPQPCGVLRPCQATP